MDNYASDEIKEIEKALKSESFFNLTDENINLELIENLKLGKKYSPKTNYAINSEIDRFNKEIILIIKPYIKSEFNISVVINPKNILEDIKNIIESNLPIKLKDFQESPSISYPSNNLLCKHTCSVEFPELERP